MTITYLAIFSVLPRARTPVSRQCRDDRFSCTSLSGCGASSGTNLYVTSQVWTHLTASAFWTVSIGVDPGGDIFPPILWPRETEHECTSMNCGIFGRWVGRTDDPFLSADAVLHHWRLGPRHWYLGPPRDPAKFPRFLCDYGVTYKLELGYIGHFLVLI